MRSESNSAEIVAEGIEAHRPALVAHCYRLLGSRHEAEDLAQEALARAWDGRASFEQSASVRTWLFRIATNACLDELRARPRRALPMDLSSPIAPGAALAPPFERARWVEPFLGAGFGGSPPTPEALYSSQESISLAFVAALQHLSPGQRAVLLLRDVLGWTASEVAGQLELSEGAVSSLLHRGRTALREVYSGADPAPPPEEVRRDVLQRYLTAWTAKDVDGLASLLAEDATFCMPPQSAWLRGRGDIAAFLRTRVLPEGDWRLAPTVANGSEAFAVFLRARGRGEFQPHGLQVLEFRGPRLASATCFLEAGLARRAP